ncbi:MAG: MerR family transcriptional regulator [Paracoccaceae bacterium]|nr:MerR family transcriptional regulator [Paracoccaceae bacterium]
MSKSADAFRTISEVADILETPTHVLRFWESRFPQVKPVKRAGGRRYYRPDDVALLGGIKRLLHEQGLAIRGVQQILKDEGVRHVMALSGLDLDAVAEALAARDVAGAVSALLAATPAPAAPPSEDPADWPEAEGTDAPAAEAPLAEPEAPPAPTAPHPDTAWPEAEAPRPAEVVTLFPSDPDDLPTAAPPARQPAKRPGPLESGWRQTSLFDDPHESEPLIEPPDAQAFDAEPQVLAPEGESSATAADLPPAPDVGASDPSAQDIPPAPAPDEAPMALDVTPQPDPEAAVAQIVSLMVGHSDPAPTPPRPPFGAPMPLSERLRTLSPAALTVGDRARLLAAYDRLEMLRNRLQQPPRTPLG